MSRKIFLAVMAIAFLLSFAATYAQDKPKRTYTKNDFVNVDGGNLTDKIERAFRQYKSSKQNDQGDSVWIAYHFAAREGSYIGPFSGTVYYDDGIKLERKDDPSQAAVFLLADTSSSALTIKRVKTLSLKEDFVFEDRMVYWLGNADTNQSLSYLSALAKQGKDDKAEKESRELARGALRAIGSHDSSRAVSMLKEFATQESNVELQRSAVSNLSRFRTAEGTDALISLYDNAKDDAVKEEIISGLSRSKERRAADKLLNIAQNDSNPKMRRSAVRRLSTANSSSGIWIN